MASNVQMPDEFELPKKESIIDESDLEYHELLGRGASGDVYRVTWKSKKIEAAAKKIPLFNDEERDRPIKETFEREVNYLRTLNHENIVDFYGHVVTPDHLVIVTEYAANGSLDNHLRKCQTRLSPSQKLEWAIQAARAIGYLQDNNVLHRDIKSGNFLITSNNTLKLCDFGISKDLASTQATESTKGTAGWLPPEVITAEAKLSPKADIFAYGIMLWELETGETPYKDTPCAERVKFMVGYKGERPKIPADCDPILKDLMQQCWHEDRRERPDVDGILHRLQLYLGSK